MWDTKKEVRVIRGVVVIIAKVCILIFLEDTFLLIFYLTEKGWFNGSTNNIMGTCDCIEV